MKSSRIFNCKMKNWRKNFQRLKWSFNKQKEKWPKKHKTNPIKRKIKINTKPNNHREEFMKTTLYKTRKPLKDNKFSHQKKKSNQNHHRKKNLMMKKSTTLKIITKIIMKTNSKKLHMLEKILSKFKVKSQIPKKMQKLISTERTFKNNRRNNLFM